MEVEENEGATKRKRDEVARGWRKQRKEDKFRAKKRKHSLSIQKRVHNPVGFYSEDWDKFQQAKDDWWVPDKWQRISHMVFCDGVLEIHCTGCI